MVERKTPNGSSDVTDLFWLEGLGSRNFSQKQKENASMVDVQVNILGTGRAEIDINCLLDLPLPHSLPCFLTFCIVFFA